MTAERHQKNKVDKARSTPTVEQLFFGGLPAIFTGGPSPEMSHRMARSFMFFAETGIFISPLPETNNNKTQSPTSPRLSSSE